MEPINVSAEYRNTWGTGDVNAPSEREFVSDMLSSGQWVEDDGNYYTREEWDSQYDEEDDCPHDNTTPADEGEPYQRECSDCDARLYLTDAQVAKFAARDDAH